MPTNIKPDLHELLSRWQQRLRMTDWAIKIRYGTEDLLDSVDHGVVSFWAPDRHALIEVKEDAPDIEAVVVHELLHCLLAPFTQQSRENSPESNAEEVVINQLTEVLVGRPQVNKEWDNWN